MLKYIGYDIVFQEIPNETTLAINISNCPCHCKGCHSSYLAEDIGETLEIEALLKLLLENKGVTCVAFMGGDSSPNTINRLAHIIKTTDQNCYKTAWYSGRSELSPHIQLENFDYIKLGPYIEESGGLNSPTTNQRLYEVRMHTDYPIYVLEDITNLFWNEY